MPAARSSCSLPACARPQARQARFSPITCLGLARVLVARGLRSPLLQRHSMRCVSASVCLSAAPRARGTLTWRRSSHGSPVAGPSALDRPASGASALGPALRQLCFQLCQPAIRLAQFALAHSGPSLAAAARHRRAMEALALRREEIGVRVAQGQPLRLDCVSARYPCRNLGRMPSSERPSPLSLEKLRPRAAASRPAR